MMDFLILLPIVLILYICEQISEFRKELKGEHIVVDIIDNITDRVSDAVIKKQKEE